MLRGRGQLLPVQANWSGNNAATSDVNLSVLDGHKPAHYGLMCNNSTFVVILVVAASGGTTIHAHGLSEDETNPVTCSLLAKFLNILP